MPPHTMQQLEQKDTIEERLVILEEAVRKIIVWINKIPWSSDD